MPVKNICNCPDPPGGNIQCSPHQMAFCGIIDGVLHRMCLDPPDVAEPQRLVKWAVEQITGKIVLVQINTSDLKMLRNGQYKQFDRVVNFVLPESIEEAIYDVEQSLNTTNSPADKYA